MLWPTMPHAQHLLALAYDRSVRGRSELVRTVADLSENSGVSERERDLIGDILLRLIKDVEKPIRNALAQILAESRNIPAEVVYALANDEIEIAGPILMRSPLLDDERLISIIRQQTERYHLAIAMRRTISEDVSQALVETGSVAVMHTLLGNEGASISSQTASTLVEHSRSMPSLQEPLVRRRELTPDLAARMYIWVTKALRDYILDRCAVQSDVIEPILAQATTGEMATLPSTPEQTTAMRAARLLASKGAINGTVLLESLKQADIDLFEALFAEMAQLPLETVRFLLYEDNGQGLTIAAAASNLDRIDFIALFLALERARNRAAGHKPLSYWLRMFNRLSDPALAQRVLERWRERHFPA
ncbi:MAG TPA: DUF2336 domain-containing protein [Dongiaceae bacterium]|jgi:uncharacterized protein (DUF2336 family)|nr:DUF2336 domain-containing protein [Dongiaceae bacterium]